MRFRLIMKRLALATSAVAGGVCLGVWALPKLQKDEVAVSCLLLLHCKLFHTRMWANAERDGRPAEYRWHPLFNAPKFG